MVRGAKGVRCIGEVRGVKGSEKWCERGEKGERGKKCERDEGRGED